MGDKKRRQEKTELEKSVEEERICKGASRKSPGQRKIGSSEEGSGEPLRGGLIFYRSRSEEQGVTAKPCPS